MCPIDPGENTAVCRLSAKASESQTKLVNLCKRCELLVENRREVHASLSKPAVRVCALLPSHSEVPVLEEKLNSAKLVEMASNRLEQPATRRHRQRCIEVDRSDAERFLKRQSDRDGPCPRMHSRRSAMCPCHQLLLKCNNNPSCARGSNPIQFTKRADGDMRIWEVRRVLVRAKRVNIADSLVAPSQRIRLAPLPRLPPRIVPEPPKEGRRVPTGDRKPRLRKVRPEQQSAPSLQGPPARRSSSALPRLVPRPTRR